MKIRESQGKWERDKIVRELEKKVDSQGKGKIREFSTGCVNVKFYQGLDSINLMHYNLVAQVLSTSEQKSFSPKCPAKKSAKFLWCQWKSVEMEVENNGSPCQINTVRLDGESIMQNMVDQERSDF